MPPARMPDKGLPPWGKGPKPPEFDGWKRGDPLPEDWDPNDRVTIPTPVDPTPVEDEDTTPALNDFKTLASYLSSIGLGELFTMTGDTPGGWLWEQVKNGVTSADQLLIELQETDVFKQRFPLIAQQQAENAAGNITSVYTPEEILQYERTITNVFKRSGLPEWFYDDPVTDIQGLMQEGISPESIVERIEDAYDYVQNAPIEVRQAFNDFYGIKDGEAALATYILDPEKTIQSLTRARRTAYAAGMGRRQNISLSESQAQQIAELPMSESGIVEGLQDVSQMAGLYRESVGESQDLTAEETGVGSVLLGNAQATEALERRRIARSAVTSSGQGGAALTQQGVVGLG